MYTQKEYNGIRFTKYQDPALSGIVKSFVEIEGQSNNTCEQIFPRNTPEILFNLAEPLCGKLKDLRPTLDTHLIQGSKTQPLTVVHPNDRHFLSIRFTPNGYFKLWGIPQHKLTNAFHPLDEIFKNVSHLLPALKNGKTAKDRFFRLSRWLKKETSKQGHSDGLLSDHIIAQLNRSPNITVQELVRTTGYTRKHLAWVFKREVGLTIKQFQKVCRFQSVLQNIDGSEDLSWVRLAYSNGYYDQSHLIRDFKQYTGTTPASYEKRF